MRHKPPFAISFTPLKIVLNILLFFIISFYCCQIFASNPDMEKGDSFIKNHQKDSALFYYDLAHQSLSKNKKDESYPILCKRMSSLYRQLGKPEEAIFLSREAINNYNSDDSLKLAHFYLTLVNAFRSLNQLDSMAKALEKVFELNWRGEDSLVTIIALSNQAYIDYKNGKHTHRKSGILEAFHIAKSNMKYAGHIAWITLYLGESEAQEKNHKAALAYFKEALSNNQETNYEMSSVLHNKIGIEFATLGKMDSAYYHQSESGKFKELHLENNKQNAILELEKQFETRLKETEILKLNSQKLATEAKNKNLKLLILLLFAIGGIIVMFFVYFKNKTRAKQKLTKQEIIVLKNQNKVNALEGLMQGQENERKRIAEELHDSIGASLSCIQLGLEKEKDTSLIEVRKMVEDCIQETRNISRNLTPYVLKKWGLIEAINILCQRTQESKEIVIHKSLKELKSPPLDYAQNIHIYRILEECFTNSLRHSHCSNIFIQALIKNNELTLSFEDDGIGFNTIDLGSKRGIGLENLKNRAEALNGTLHIETSPDAGCLIILKVSLS